MGVLWYYSVRLMQYSGMNEHWGHTGAWWGFPDMSSFRGVVSWLFNLLMAIGNYGTRELGIVLHLFGIVGFYKFWQRQPTLAILFAAPYPIAILGALLGKYPLSGRTIFFLLPVVWILAAAGIGGMIEYSRKRGREIAFVGLLLLAWDSPWMLRNLIHPDEKYNYRDSYRYIHEHRQPSDRIFSQMAVVYYTYHGHDEIVLPDDWFDGDMKELRTMRIWVVAGVDRLDIRNQIVAAGGRLAHEHREGAMVVWLFDPKWE